ncbi:hypothetical protein GCM10028895_00290 [Pontibacter rugosus]
MMQKTVVLNIVGLTQSLIGKHTPHLAKWAANVQQASIKPVLPAVTCTVQSTYLTGKWPEEHGIVANGWYFRDEDEIKLWRQSNKLVQAPKVWEVARKADPNFTVANMGWWYNMNTTADYTLTPRPQYLADGRKMPDCYTQPLTFGISYRRNWVLFRCSTTGARKPLSSRASGLQTQVRLQIIFTTLRSHSFTSHTWITTCSASVHQTRALPKIYRKLMLLQVT